LPQDVTFPGRLQPKSGGATSGTCLVHSGCRANSFGKSSPVTNAEIEYIILMVGGQLTREDLAN
jgi:hypothetical protein